MPDAPKALLTRAVTFETRSSGDGFTLEGYAAVFDTPTRINSWEGNFDEQIARGAFAKTLKERTPYLMFQHGRHPLFGSLPIGQITELAEDSRGLRVSARLADNWLVEPVRDAIANGSVSGMSIMFEPMKESRDESGDVPIVTRSEVKLLELGPVVFPAYDSTEVGVRSLADLNDLRKIRIITTQDAPEAAEVPEEDPATPEEAAPEGTSDEAGADPERSTPPEVLALYARILASRPTP